MARFDTRGIVLCPDDLTWADWPRRAAEAGLNTIGLHLIGNEGLAKLCELIQGSAGQRFLADAAEHGLAVEYELHAMHDLLPRELFTEAPELFRVDDSGARVPEWNLCPSSADALRVVSDNAVRLAGALRPTTHRYFMWADDGCPWCRCAACRQLTPSDQNLVVMNAIAVALRRLDPHARLAALAYDNTLKAPRSVRPEPNVFLEYAPIRRDSSRPLNDPSCEENRRHAELIDPLLEVFGTEGAQVLEYWMDVSRFSGWRRPAVRLPLDSVVLEADLAFYAEKGFRHATSFGCYIDAEYVRRHGIPPVAEYGAALS
ncbi:MAG TPA: DUF4838 domain-containing protein, partial [Armatimonadota bacterium]|nr:DUF4838 domain-containing protein [Armatimonadota bacterium]